MATRGLFCFLVGFLAGTGHYLPSTLRDDAHLDPGGCAAPSYRRVNLGVAVSISRGKIPRVIDRGLVLSAMRFVKNLKRLVEEVCCTAQCGVNFMERLPPSPLLVEIL